MRKARLILIIIAGLLVAGVLIRLIGRATGSAAGETGNARSQGPVAIETATATYRTLIDRAEFTGTIKPSYQYVVSAKVTGRLMSLHRRIGDRVRRDEIIGRIDDTEYLQAMQEADAQVRVSRASVAEAQAQAGYTSRELERVTGLVTKGISSQAELDALQTQSAAQQSRVELAAAQLAQREAMRAQAQTRLGYTALRAAQPGLVAARHADGGAQLTAGSPVLTIVGIDTVYVELAVTEREYARITIGQNAAVTLDALGGRVFDGVVRHAAPMFDATTRTAIAEIAVVNDSLLLKPGMFAKITITFSSRDSALVVPSAAIVQSGGNPSVYLIEGDTARLVPVQTGLAEGGWVEVLSPVISSPVATLGNHLLRDGAIVRVADSPGASRPDTAR